MAKKYRIQQLQSDETLLTLHPETDASIVKVDTSKTGTTATNVEDALKELKDTIGTGSGGVTGVKGSAESSYRKGNVEITKANIGLGNVNNTSDADKPISTAVQAALDNVTAVANGKTKTYVVSATINTMFDTNNDEISTSTVGSITTISGDTVNLTSLKIGDIILVTELAVPDRYVGLINNEAVTIKFFKMETSKVDLSNYLPLSGGTMTGDLKMKDKHIIFNKEEDNMKIGYDENDAKMFIDMQNSDYYKAQYHASGFRVGNNAIEANLDVEESKFEFSLGNNISKITPDGFSASKEGTSTSYDDGGITRYIDNYSKYVEIKLPNKSGTLALISNVTGVYSAVQVTNGIVTGGANMIEIGATGATAPSANLASGGIFFQEI